MVSIRARTNSIAIPMAIGISRFDPVILICDTVIMCGRWVREADVFIIKKEFGVEVTLYDPEPSYNIAPTQRVAVIIIDGIKKLVPVKWGLIPSWAKDPSIASKMINARAETVAVKPSFKQALRKRRCLIVADGFYEWKKDGASKTPVYIHLKTGKPFGFAGLFERWRSPEGVDITTCTIITTEANELMSPIHNRMPVIIPKDLEDKWLDPSLTDSAELVEMLKPFPPELMEAYAVSRAVNSPANNSPDCIKPV